MKTRIIALIGTLMLAATVQARLGESIEQCKERYGEPKRSALDTKLTGLSTYEKNDLVITIHFLNGKADLVRYSPGQISRVDLDLAKFLLQLNGRTKEWDQLTKTQIVLQDVQDEAAQYPRIEIVDPILWKSKDGILDANFSVGKGTFEVKDATYLDRIREGL